MTRGLTALAFALVLGATTAPAADDPKLPDTKTFDKLVVDSLREVHNKGADLYNTSKDFVGAYRMYQGALVAVRPLLAHRPEAQKIIDTGLAAAEKAPNQADGTPDFAKKAFLLHEAIEGVRKHLKEAVGGKKPDDKKPEEKKPKDTPPGVAVSGKITFADKPVAGGEVAFTSVSAEKPKTVKAKTADDGTYKLPESLPPGKYAITVTGTGVPAKYKTADTSGLVVELTTGPHIHDIVLK